MIITTFENIKVGDQYKSGKSIQEVKEIIIITDKTIEFRTKRIKPDYYDGDFYQRPRLNTKVTIINK